MSLNYGVPESCMMEARELSSADLGMEAETEVGNNKRSMAESPQAGYNKGASTAGTRSRGKSWAKISRIAVADSGHTLYITK